jgi:Carboxypeptidase regulatory-like domain
MSIRSLGRSRLLVYAALAAFAGLVMPFGLSAGAGAESGTLAGFVYAKDAKTPVAGAVVKLRNVADMKEVTSPPTDANGMYSIAGIPEGRYLVGVTSSQADFNLDYALYVKSGELGKLSISLAPGAGQEAGEAAAKKKGFFSSVAGRVLIVSAIGVGLYVLIVDNEPSPIR